MGVGGGGGGGVFVLSFSNNISCAFLQRSTIYFRC